MFPRSLLDGRLNTKLEAQGYPPMTSLVKDLSDGVRLIQLMVCGNLFALEVFTDYMANSGDYG
jgi:cofilin